MAGATFGRKGLADRTAAAPSPRVPFGAAAPTSTPADPADPYAELKASFLASERARRGDPHEAGARENPAPAQPTPLPRKPAPKEPPFPGEKSIVVAYALWLVLGAMSVHRLYLGRPLSALGQWALWYGGFFLYFAGHDFAVAPMGAGILWLLADGYFLPGMLRETNDKLRSRLALTTEAEAEPA